MQAYFLAPGVHFAAIRNDLVFLDTRTDSYLCLPGAEAERIDEWRLACGPDTAACLADAGLLGDGAAPVPYRTRPLPPRATRGVNLNPDDRGMSLVEAGSLTSAWVRRVGRRPTIARLALDAGGRRRGPTDAAALARAVRLFRGNAPLFPAVGACLFQAWWMLGFLQARGLDADWVFGVRTWPFAAHCWLQSGDLCLTEPPEILTIYRPLLAI